MGENIAIEFKNVIKSYKLYKDDKQRLFSMLFNKKNIPEKIATNDVSFTIHKGESVAFFGRNGAGKSTILKMITEVLYPTSGEITINGRVSALLELTAGFDSHLTGRQNIYFRGQLMGISEEEIKLLEPEIVEFAELGPYIDQPVKNYSSGMKARLGFAVNAHVQPEILIVDEALSVGDKLFRAKCREKLNEILKSGDITFLFVTHSTPMAKRLCERGIVMKDGTLMYDGEINAAADFYDNMLVADGMKKPVKKGKNKKKKQMNVATATAENGSNETAPVESKESTELGEM